MTRKKPFQIPSILESIARDMKAGKINISEAADELCAAGWMNYHDEEKAAELLRKYMEC